MQNRYAGDVGDFGKFGLLRYVSRSGLTIEINWYLVPNESHNADGKHTGYLHSKDFEGCDNELLLSLTGIVSRAQRDIGSLQAAELIPNGKYYNATLYPPKTKGALPRIEWHHAALWALEKSDIIFLDPDNGLIVKSVGSGSHKSNKYVLEDELVDYYRAGHSVIFYNHRCRKAENDYLEPFRKLKNYREFDGAEWLGLKFVRGTIRDYFFILQPYHAAMLSVVTDSLLGSNWGRHFIKLNI